MRNYLEYEEVHTKDGRKFWLQSPEPTVTLQVCAAFASRIAADAVCAKLLERYYGDAEVASILTQSNDQIYVVTVEVTGLFETVKLFLDEIEGVINESGSL